MHSRDILRTLFALGFVAATASTASAQEDWESGDPGTAEPAQEQTGGTGGAEGGAAGGGEASGGEFGGPVEASTGLELAYAQRGITLSQGALRVNSAPYEWNLNNSGLVFGPGAFGIAISKPFVDGSGVSATWGIGASYGIMDELEVGALLLPISMNPGGFGDMAIYGRYAFIRSDSVEIGGQLALTFPTGGYQFGFGFGLPMSFKLSEVLRLDVGAELELYARGGSTVIGDIPVSVTYNITEAGFVGGHSGVTLAETDGNGADWQIPIGAHGGYTLALDPVLLDFVGQLTFFIFEGEQAFSLIFGANATFDVGPH